MNLFRVDRMRHIFEIKILDLKSKIRCWNDGIMSPVNFYQYLRYSSTEEGQVTSDRFHDWRKPENGSTSNVPTIF